MSKLEPYQDCSLCSDVDVTAIAGVRLCQRHLDLTEAIAADAGVPREVEVSKPVVQVHASQRMVQCPHCPQIIKGAGPAARHRRTHEVLATEHRAPSTEHRAPSTEHRAPSTEQRKTSQPSPQARNIKIAEIAHFDISRIRAVAQFVGIAEAEVTRLIGCLEYIHEIATSGAG